MPPILQHLFKTWSWTTMDLVNHLWQSTAVGLAVLVLLAVCSRLSAGTRRALAGMALAKFALPAACFSWLVKSTGGTPERWLASHPLTLPVNLPPEMFTRAVATAPAHASSPSLPGLLVVAVWLAGFGLLIAFWLGQGWRVRRGLLAKATPVSTALERQIAAAALRAGLRQPPRGRVIDHECGPGVVGIFSPVIILPRGLELTLTPAELDAVLIHECVHLRRRDNVWAALQALMVSVLWFNPVVWLLHRRLGVEMEKSCDEQVLEITGDPDSYAGGIVKSIRHALGLAQPGWAGVTTPPVVARIKNILAHGSRPRRPLARGMALAAGVLLLALSGYAGSLAAITVQPAQVVRWSTATATGHSSQTEQFAAVIPHAVMASLASEPAPSAKTSRSATTLRATENAGASVAPPEAGTVGRSGLKGTNTIAIDRDGGISFNGKVVTDGQLLSVLQALRNVDKDIPVLITADETTQLKKLAFVMDACRKAGLNKFSLQTGTSATAAAPGLPAPAETLVVSAPPKTWYAPATPSDNPESAVRVVTKDQMADFVMLDINDVFTYSDGTGTRGRSSPAGPVAAVTASDSVTPSVAAVAVQEAVPKIYELNELDQIPMPISQGHPLYPFELRRNDIVGDVALQFVVDANGDVREARAIKSSASNFKTKVAVESDEFAASAVKALRKWKFVPGQKNGHAVDTNMHVDIVFQLNDQ